MAQYGNQWWASAGGGFEVFACDWDHNSSSKMSRTLGTPTNVDKWTCSWWEKRNSASRYSVSMSGYSSGEHYDYIFHASSTNDIRWEAQNGTSSYSVYSTSGYGSGTWRHYVFHYDSTNGTSSDRLNIFINGSQVSESTRYSGHPASGRDSYMNTSGKTWSIGHIPTYNGYADSLFSECVFIDGSIVAASVFGEDKGGTWSAKDFKDNVTFGNNGHYLTFSNSSSLGADSSGNSNDFTVSAITADHQRTDDLPPT